jgi:glutamine cyclotransferase
MRSSLTLSLFCAALAASGQSTDRSEGSPKHTRAAKTPKPAGPKGGIKIPGVLIPFASLKAEAEIPGLAPAWMTAADALIVPGAGGSILKIDNRSNKPGEAVAEMGKDCEGAVSAFNSLWAADCAAHTIVRIDSKTWKITATIPAGTSDFGPAVAASSDSVWALSDKRSTLVRIDPDQNAVVSELRVDAGCNTLTFGETALWVTCPAANAVLRINPQTNLVEKRIEVSEQPAALALGENSVWVLCLKDGKVERIDPKTNKVSKSIALETPGSAWGGIAVGGGWVWVSLDGFPLARIDPAAEKVAQQFWGEGGGAIQFGFNAIWLSNLKQNTLWRIDPKRVEATLAE